MSTIRATLFAFFIAVIAFVAVHAHPAQAQPQDNHEKAADVAVTAIYQTVTTFAGVPLSRDEIDFVKQVVTCLLRNPNYYVACARGNVAAALVAQLPVEAQPFAQCIWNGRDMATCGSDQIVAQISDENARNAARCITTRADVGACAWNAAEGSRWRRMLEAVDKFKADSRGEIQSGENAAIHNVIAMAEGIRDDDWTKVSVAVTGEIYKAAGKIVLYAVLPLLVPARPVLDPLVDAILQERIDALQDIIKGAKAGNAGVIADVLLEVYLKQTYLIACKLQEVPGIPREIFDATCGKLAPIIHALGSTAGDVANGLFDLIKDPLNIPQALWDDVKGIVNDARHIGKQHNCIRPEHWYARHYAMCMGKGAIVLSDRENEFDGFAEQINQSCRRYYAACYLQEELDDICNPMYNLYVDHARGYVRALFKGADSLRRSFRPYLGQQCRRPDDFNRLYGQFSEEECAAKLATERKQIAGRDYGNFYIEAGGEEQQCRYAGGESPFRSACARSMAGLDKERLKNDMCAPFPEEPQNCVGNASCGSLVVQCKKPLPTDAREYRIIWADDPAPPGRPFPGTISERVLDEQITGVVRKGMPDGPHEAAFDRRYRVCAINQSGSNCSRPFAVHFPGCNWTDGPIQHAPTCPNHGVYCSCAYPSPRCYPSVPACANACPQ
jgi:hypothetical protein